MSTEIPPLGRDPGAAARLQILATEHWSLLATRALTYNEALSRVTIFLSILSGALIALALVAQADHFGAIFISIAIPMLLIVMFVGITTVSRLTALNRDDYRWVIGMNRVRHGYLELHPELADNFVTSPYDDLRGALQTLGIEDVESSGGVGSVFHLMQTLPGMVVIIVAAVGGAIGALVARAFGAGPTGMVLAATAGFALIVLLMWLRSRRAFSGSGGSLKPRFPSPPG
jgi:hypothetical protein